MALQSKLPKPALDDETMCPQVHSKSIIMKLAGHSWISTFQCTSIFSLKQVNQHNSQHSVQLLWLLCYLWLLSRVRNTYMDLQPLSTYLGTVVDQN